MALNRVERIDGPIPIRRVIASVSDKRGLEELVPGLVEANPEIRIFSTGGTFAVVRKILGETWPANLTAVSEYTGQPEMQGGLVKTLDFRIYLGLLSETYNPHHEADLRRAGAVPIDMVIVNLYPFRSVSSAAGSTIESCRANIDIGGPCMIRAAAKNFHRVAAVTDPADYPRILSEIAGGRGSLSLETRFELARKAFRNTAEYDTAIAEYLGRSTFAEVESSYRVEP